MLTPQTTALLFFSLQKLKVHVQIITDSWNQAFMPEARIKLHLYNTEKWYLIANLQGQVLHTQDGDDCSGEKNPIVKCSFRRSSLPCKLKPEYQVLLYESLENKSVLPKWVLPPSGHFESAAGAFITSVPQIPLSLT